MLYDAVLSSDRQLLLAELCRGEISATSLSGVFALTFSATAMIEGSLPPRGLNFPTNKFFTKPATLGFKVISGSLSLGSCRSHASGA